MNHLVSIITPSYNSSNFISQTIVSALNQIYQNWEMIIVDDCSSDNSIDIIKEYADKDNRIKLIELTKNIGVASARNVAIKEAKGRYIAFLDADDLWKPEKLVKQIKFMQSNSLAFAYSSYDVISEDGNSLGLFVTKKIITYKSMLKTCSVGCLTAVYDVKKLGKLYFQNSGREDYVLWLMILKNIGCAKGMLEPLASYRIVSGSLSSNKFRIAQLQWKVYRDFEKMNFIRSAYYFLHYVYYGYLKYKNK